MGWITFFWPAASSVTPSIPSAGSASFFSVSTIPLGSVGGWMAEAFTEDGEVVLLSLPSFFTTTPAAVLPCSSWDLSVSTSLCFCLNILVSSSICLSFSCSIWSLSKEAESTVVPESAGCADVGEDPARLQELWTSSLTTTSEETLDGC